MADDCENKPSDLSSKNALPGLSHEAMLEDLRLFVDLLESKSINTKSSRLMRYIRYLEAVISGEPFDHFTIFRDRGIGPIKHEIDRQLYVLREATELMWIYGGLKLHEPEGVDEKLKMLVGGRDFALLDGNSASRDAQFELRIASYFCRSGYEVDMSTLTDIVARSKKDAFFVECKRVASRSKIVSNLNAAAKQIHLRCPRKGRKYGVIALEFTQVATSNGICYGNSPDDIKSAYQERLSAMTAGWHHLKTIYRRPKNLLIWKQIHLPGISRFPPLALARFSSLFDVNPDSRGGNRRAFGRLFEVLSVTDYDDPRLEEIPEQKLKRSITIPKDSIFSWDMEVLKYFSEHLTLPDVPNDHVVLRLQEPDCDAEEYSFFELKSVTASLPEFELYECFMSVENCMRILLPPMRFWRDPYSREG